MRITRVSTTPIRIPVSKAPYESAGAGTRFHWGGRRSRVTPKRPQPMLEYVLVRIETDEGVTGIGEAQADIGFFGETVEEVQVAVDDYLGPQLVVGQILGPRRPDKVDRLRIDFEELGKLQSLAEQHLTFSHRVQNCTYRGSCVSPRL